MDQKIGALIQIAGGRWLEFGEPKTIVATDRRQNVRDVLREVERAAETGCYGVGFVTYEAAGAFGLSVSPHGQPSDLPLIWFAIYEPPQVRERPSLVIPSESYRLGSLSPSISRGQFDEAFARIKEHLAAGDSYQVNYTFRLEGSFEGHALALFADLVDAQGGAHSAFLNVDGYSICSASPELFFSKQGDVVTTRPMKGTTARGRTTSEDISQQAALRSSLKQQAENVMIVDMMRNDLGRVANLGSVAVTRLFDAEKYPNLWQMTSTVESRSTASLEALFEALHPSASVTGAPKVRTMQILSALESGPRGVYTGAIGYVRPGGDAHFNVGIRTAVVDHRAGRLSFGIGSGIVWDSVDRDEYDECLLKGSVLGRRPMAFDLLETMRWTEPQGVFLLKRHLERLEASAEYFGYPYEESEVHRALDEALTAHQGSEGEGPVPPLRIRLLLSRDGTVRVETRLLLPAKPRLHVSIASEPVDPGDRFLFHKTTNRTVYDRALAGADGSDEVILWNPHREITEASTANIIVDAGDALVTPPVSCGLLAGTFRAELLARGEIVERVVTVDQLREAARFWLVNSVREWQAARLRETTRP